jgi:hypothetical protein
VIVGAPDYLSSLRVLGRSPRHRFLVIPNSVPVTSLRGDSALYCGIRLWNVLPSADKSFFSIGTFKRFMTTADSSNLIVFIIIINLPLNTYMIFI